MMTAVIIYPSSTHPETMRGGQGHVSANSVSLRHTTGASLGACQKLRAVLSAFVYIKEKLLTVANSRGLNFNCECKSLLWRTVTHWDPRRDIP